MTTNRKREFRTDALATLGRDDWDRDALAFVENAYFRIRVVRALKPVLLGNLDKSRLRGHLQTIEGDLRRLRESFDAIDPQLWVLLAFDPDSLEPGSTVAAGKQPSIVSRIAEELHTVDECLSSISRSWPRGTEKNLNTFSLAPLLEDVLFALERRLGTPTDRPATAASVLMLIEKHLGFGKRPEKFEKIFHAVDRRLKKRASLTPPASTPPAAPRRHEDD